MIWFTTINPVLSPALPPAFLALSPVLWVLNPE
jgi:hypothetical protein